MEAKPAIDEAKQCYMCENAGTSREHVPPKCLFPEEKDVPGGNYRDQMITVPSCDVHNTAKSKDDEFLLASVTGLIGNNVVGYMNNCTKVQRAVLNSSGNLLNATFSNQKKVQLKLGNGKAMPFILGKPDLPRLMTCFDRMVLGLYRHHFKVKFRGKTKSVMIGLIHDEKNPNAFADFIKARAEIDFKNVPRHGSHLSVFYYQFLAPDEFGISLVKMCFYEGFEVYTAMMPEGAKTPYNLGWDLINRGLKTVVDLGDKKFEFN